MIYICAIFNKKKIFINFWRRRYSSKKHFYTTIFYFYTSVCRRRRWNFKLKYTVWSDYILLYKYEFSYCINASFFDLIIDCCCKTAECFTLNLKLLGHILTHLAFSKYHACRRYFFTIYWSEIVGLLSSCLLIIGLLLLYWLIVECCCLVSFLLN